MIKNILVSRSVLWILVFGFFGAFIISCTFVQPQPEQLEISLVQPFEDTVDTYPVISFAFSIPLSDNSVSFVLSPDPGQDAAYYTSVNTTLDTARLIIHGMLQGRTTYEIFPSGEIQAANGTVFKPSDGSWKFTTRPREQEPNDHISIADTLYDLCCGSIDRSDDIDWYVITNDQAKSVVVDASAGPCGITLMDAHNKMITTESLTTFDPSKIKRLDTLSIPDSMTAPYAFSVRPVIAGEAKHYRVYLIEH